MNKIALICFFLYMPFITLAQETLSITDYTNFAKYDSANSAKITSGTSPKVVLMGNSITEGWVSMRPEFFTDNGFEGRGIGGQVSHQMLLRFQTDVIALKPKAVVILAGTNDIAQNSGPVSIGQTMDNIRSMAELAQINEIDVMLCSVLPARAFPWFPDVEPVELIKELNVLIKEYCDSKGLTYVDYYKAMVDDQGGLKVPDYTSADDLVHPNAKGYEVMEAVLLKALKPWLDEQ